MKRPTDRNVALGKTATASSSFGVDTASMAVSGELSPDYSFSTEIEDNPWWQLDLGSAYDIHRIVITNRKIEFQRARSLVVKVGLESSDLRVVHDQGGEAFGDDGCPLDLEFPYESARFIRLELRDKQYLHLNQVEVYEGREATPIEPLPITTKADDRLRELGCTPRFGRRHEEYAWIPHGENKTGELIGVEFHSESRFGNALMADMDLLQAAKYFGVPNVRLGAHTCFKASFSQTWNGLNVVIGRDQPLIGSGVLLRGHFSDRDSFPGLTQMSYDEEHQSSFELLRNMLDLPTHRRLCDPDEYAIHIRSGDIFENYFHESYVQPPLAFYKVAIRDALSCGDITKVLLVFENRSNPCIDALIAHLHSKSIPYRLQSSTLIDDISALLDCKHLTFGTGTFGPAISWLSRELITVRYFFQGFYHPRNYKWIKRPYAYIDILGNYMKPGEWSNQQGKLEMMLTYPESAIVLEN